MGFWRDAAWADVRQKAKRIKRTNKVEVTDYEPGWMAAFVEGDTDEYFVDMAFRNYTNKMLRWTCDCKWGQWAPHRETYTNRTCSHAYALFLKRQSWQKSGVEYWAEDDE